jgi:hypothetical protein
MLSSSILLKLVPKKFREFVKAGGGGGGVIITQDDSFPNFEEYKNEDLCWATVVLPPEDFTNSVLVHLYTMGVAAQPIPDSCKEMLIYYKIPFILIGINGLNEGCDLGSGVSFEDTIHIKHFLRWFRQNIQETLLSEFKHKFILDLADFYVMLVDSASLHGYNQYENLIELLEPFPVYLTKSLRRSLLFLSLHPDTKKMQYRLQNSMPKLYLLDHPLPKLLTAAELYEILVRLPKKVNMVDFIQDFERSIWKAHIHGNMSKFNIKGGGDLTARDLLAQIICFLLPNWYQLWVEMFSYSFEIQRRLWYLKKKKWSPPIDDFARIFG